MRTRDDESGQVLVLTALSMVLLMGFTALAVDVGVLFRAKRNLQIAADAAATAGVQNLHYGLSASTAARAAATANGMTGTCGGSGTKVCVYSPAVDGPNAGVAGFVEVTISQPEPTTFMGIITHNNFVAVSARAVGGTSSSTGCIYTLGTTGTDIDITGSGNISLPSCGILDDSSSSSGSSAPALKDTASGNLTASSIQIVGGYNISSMSGTFEPDPPTTGMIPVSNPLSALTPPSFTTASCVANPNVSNARSIGPTSGGTICYNGLTISAGGSGTVTLNPGIYVINGNLSLTGSAPVSGTGVTFYFPSAGDQAKVTGSGALTLTAPTSGTYNGILFYQNPSDTTQMQITASGTSTIKGIIYAPTANLDLTGSGASSFYTSLVVGTLTMTGSLPLQDYAVVNSNSPLRSPLLVE